jgi:hypothetical protein
MYPNFPYQTRFNPESQQSDVTSHGTIPSSMSSSYISDDVCINCVSPLRVYKAPPPPTIIEVDEDGQVKERQDYRSQRSYNRGQSQRWAVLETSSYDRDNRMTSYQNTESMTISREPAPSPPVRNSLSSSSHEITSNILDAMNSKHTPIQHKKQVSISELSDIDSNSDGGFGSDGEFDLRPKSHHESDQLNIKENHPEMMNKQITSRLPSKRAHFKEPDPVSIHENINENINETSIEHPDIEEISQVATIQLKEPSSVQQKSVNLHKTEKPKDANVPSKSVNVTKTEQLKDANVPSKSVDVPNTEQLTECTVQSKSVDVPTTEQLKDANVPSKSVNVAKTEQLKDANVPSKSVNVAKTEQLKESNVPSKSVDVPKTEQLKEYNVPSKSVDVPKTEQLKEYNVPSKSVDVPKTEQLKEANVQSKFIDHVKGQRRTYIPFFNDEIYETSDSQCQLTTDKNGTLIDLTVELAAFIKGEPVIFPFGKTKLQEIGTYCDNEIIANFVNDEIKGTAVGRVSTLNDCYVITFVKYLVDGTSLISFDEISLPVTFSYRGKL